MVSRAGWSIDPVDPYAIFSYSDLKHGHIQGNSFRITKVHVHLPFLVVVSLLGRVISRSPKKGVGHKCCLPGYFKYVQMVHPCWGLPCFQECCFVVISSNMFLSLILKNSSHPKYATSVADALFISLQNARIIPTEKKNDMI